MNHLIYHENLRNMSLTVTSHCTALMLHLPPFTNWLEKPESKRGYHVCHNLNREGLVDVPVSAEELLKMSDRLERYACGRLNNEKASRIGLETLVILLC